MKPTPEIFPSPDLTTRVASIEHARQLWTFGMLFRYPRCCVHAFVDDRVAGRHPALLRPVLNGCVLCWRCARIGTLSGLQEDDEIDMQTGGLVPARIG